MEFHDRRGQSYSVSEPEFLDRVSLVFQLLLIIHALFIFLDQEKKPYIEKAAELKAQAENGEGSGVSPSSLLCLPLPCWTWSCVSASYYYLKHISLIRCSTCDAGEQCCQEESQGR